MPRLSKSGNHGDFRQCEPRVIGRDGNIITMDELVNVEGGERLAEQLRRLAARQSSRDEAA